jgi:2-amino-4-hydroxy-6-hydroxymethyldihydropteridine diphosphokinase
VNDVIIGLGSNVDPDRNIREARARIPELGTLVSESEFVRTEPVDAPDQPWFVNGAIRLATDCSLEELRGQLREIEVDLGRPRFGDRSGPRTIDLDILVWNRKVVDSDVFERDFLMSAVRNLCPDLDLDSGHG